jgi:plasmid stabilization system protein ParE
MVVKKYLIFFVIDEEKGIVRVRRIIHGARDWQRILSEEQ